MLAFEMTITPFCAGAGDTVSCETAARKNPLNMIEKNIFFIINILLVIEIVNINCEQAMTVTMITTSHYKLITWRCRNNRCTASFFTIHLFDKAGSFSLHPFLH